jgi:hypothetical protein
MKVLAGIVAALALIGVTGAYAQYYPYPGYYPYPAYYQYPGYYPYPGPPVAVAPAPPAAVAPGYIPGPVPGSVVVNPYTGRWCTFQPDGWRWCWTP